MPLKILRGDAQAPLRPLQDKAVAVIGYGNQGRAHALNLRDSGIRVVVGHRQGTANDHRAHADGFDTMPLPDATSQGDLVVVALPDESQPEIFAAQIAPYLKATAVVGFLHGFNVRFGYIKPAPGLGVVMIAPKGPGQTLRERYKAGLGLPCLYALHQESANADTNAIALAWANGIGCARAGIICTTIADETETDLFGEQAVLCGGMTHLILAAFETLVNAGYPPELAYLECCHEVKQIADLVYAGGLSAMMKSISNTAEFGAYRSGPLMVPDAVRANMQEALREIRTGSFALAVRQDYLRGFEWFDRQRQALRSHPIEPAGDVIRALMTPSDDSTSSHRTTAERLP